jgi:hypothetical protein
MEKCRIYLIVLLNHPIQFRGDLGFRIAQAAGIHDRLHGGSKGMLGNKTFRRFAEDSAAFAILNM